jgi:hypothetical protein
MRLPAMALVLAPALFVVAATVAVPAAAAPRPEVREDWEFQFRTMGYGPIDARTAPQRVDSEAAAARPGDRDGVDAELRRAQVMLDWWQAREPDDPRWPDYRKRWGALRTLAKDTPLDPGYADPRSTGARRKLLLDAQSLRRQIGGAKPLPRPGPVPHLLRNDETARGVSLDDPPLLDRQSRFWPQDRDQVDVVLRRTRALLDYWFARPPARARWRPFGEELAVLEANARRTQPDLAGKDPARHKVYLDLCALRRRIVLANPLLDFDDLVFIEHSDVANCLERVKSYGVPRPGGGLYVMRGLKSDSLRLDDLLATARPANGDYARRGLTNGIFRRPEVGFDGKTVYFAWAELKPNPHARNTGRDYVPGPYHLFRVNADGTGLRQLTFGPRSDLEPCELPNGRILFCSTRRDSGDRCCMINRTSFFLHSMKPDGSDILCLSFHETHEWEPSVDDDGMVVYQRWDYVDRPSRGPRNMWLCHPDGSNPRAPHGNYGPYVEKGIFDPPVPGYHDSRAYLDWRNGPPHSEASIRAIPGSHRYVAVAGGHDWNGIGPIILIDLKVPDNYLHSQITRVTPEFYEHDNQVMWNMVWATPWPLSEDFYLVNRFESIGILDRFGNFELIHHMAKADAENRAFAHTRLRGCWGGMGTNDQINGKASELDGAGMYWRPIFPMPLKPRPRPPVLPTRTFQEADRRGTPGHQPATISVMNVYDTDVPLPAGTKVKWMRLVLLNEEGLAVRGMKSVTYAHRGEHLSCAGCHEKYSGPSRAPKSVPLALRRAPSKIQPEFPAGDDPTIYARHIEPILDSVCVRCHREKKKGPAALTFRSLSQPAGGGASCTTLRAGPNYSGGRHDSTPAATHRSAPTSSCASPASRLAPQASQTRSANWSTIAS